MHVHVCVGLLNSFELTAHMKQFGDNGTPRLILYSTHDMETKYGLQYLLSVVLECSCVNITL